MNKTRPVIFGEVLFDCFPDGSQVLGGAPFNVAWHLQAFGNQPCFVSNVGDDAQGEAIRNAALDWGMDGGFLGTDHNHPTGRVDVTIEDNEPHYDIVENCAYDFISADNFKSLTNIGFVYHGSLALRNAVTRQSLESLVADYSPAVFMDVNLRPPWWQKEQVLAWFAHARWLKLNHDELKTLVEQYDDAEDAAKWLIDRFDIETVIVTQGEQGATVINARGERYQQAPPRPHTFVDTVGAGDAFTARFIHGLLCDESIEETLQAALQFGSQVVGLRGATTTDKSFYGHVIG